MTARVARALGVALLAALAGCAVPRMAPVTCPLTLVAAGARCGTIAVPEDWQRHGGRTIALHVVVLPATDSTNRESAQLDLEGGPGFGVTDSARFYAADGAAYRKSRDVVLVDMRGTGQSNPLRCTAIEELEEKEPWAPLYPPELVTRCVDELSPRADLRAYTTANASRDLEAVRRALGYERWDLNALSYGTTLALRYIADHPDRVRTAVLLGTVPASETPPAHHAEAADRGLKTLLDACAADPDCASRHRDPFADLDRALARLEPGKRPVFLEDLRSRMYAPATAREVPSLLAKAAEGDFASFDGGGSGGRVFADGLYISITCAESLGRIDLDRAIAESDATRVGSYRLTRQRDACARWPKAAGDPLLFRTGTYQVPVLFLSGALDPVTPTAWSVEAAKQFPESRLVVVPQGGHVLDGLSGLDTCIDDLVLKFVSAGSAAGLDTSCVESMSRGGFAP